MCTYFKLHTSAYYYTDSNHITQEQSADLFMLFLLIVKYILLVLLR